MPKSSTGKSYARWDRQLDAVMEGSKNFKDSDKFMISTVKEFMHFPGSAGSQKRKWDKLSDFALMLMSTRVMTTSQSQCI